MLCSLLPPPKDTSYNMRKRKHDCRQNILVYSERTLCTECRTIPSLMSFRRELKSTLFNISFSGSDM